MRWDVAGVVAATGGAPTGGAPTGGAGAAASFEAVTTDSRRVPPGSLFVPIRAARDGHDFVAAAVTAGAAGYLVEAGHPLASAPVAGATAVVVVDTARALLDLGRAARGRLRGPVVGITGSVGKTSTKDLLATALGEHWRVTASEQSFNNELGVPLTLANAAEDTQVAVIEMGARGIGHIALLCDVARPTVGIVTAVAAVHTELLGSLEGVQRAKSELPEALPADGTAVLNADDPRVHAMGARTGARVLRYSAAGAPGADVTAESVVIGEDLRPRFRLASAWGSAGVTLAARGAHQVGNALAAAGAALACGTPLEAVVAGLERGVLSHWRMELTRTPAGATVVNDAYNANPASVAAALRALAALPARRRLAVLGEMAELGPEGPAEHRAVAALAAELGIELHAVATAAYGVAPLAGGTDDPAAVVAALGALGAGDAVLVKGSRVTRLERVAAALATPGA